MLKFRILYIYEQSNVDKKIKGLPFFKTLRLGGVGGQKNKIP